MKQTLSRFWELFRLIFTLFSLYSLLDVIHRWNGFSFYASFLEYIPAVALLIFLWSIIAVLTTILIYILLELFERIFKVDYRYLLLYGIINMLLGFGVWKIKRFLFPYTQTSNQLKMVVFICVVLVSVYFIWAFRNKVKRFFESVQEGITPLVWLFGIPVLISIPLIICLSSISAGDTNKPIPEEYLSTQRLVSTISKSNQVSPNIILIVFDTLTARDMSLYGYHRDTTPFINRWASNATVFTKAYASNNHTSPTVASLLTGKRVWTHQVYHQAGTVPLMSDIESLPSELKKHGYFNVAFVVNQYASVKKMGMLDSFDIAPLSSEFYKPRGIISFDERQWGLFESLFYQLFGEKIRIYDWIIGRKFLGRLQAIFNPKSKLMNPELTRTVVPPEIAFNKFLNIVDNLPQPFFAWIHLFPPHAYYLPPPPYRGVFGPYFPPQRYKEFVSDLDSNDLHDARILYDEFIRYCDEQFKEFITQLEKKEMMKNSVIILTSDHGESFEHNVYQHKVPELYEQLTHIPFVIKTPYQRHGKVINDLVEQIDIPATILELAHIDVPTWMEGRSVVPLLSGEKLSPKPIFSMYLERNRSRGHLITKGTIAVWEGDYKLIHYLEENKSLLFNLRDDPDELNNLIDKEPEIAQHLLSLIKEELRKANERIVESSR